MHRRALIYYLLTPAVLTLYGTQVCPFLESLPAWVLLANLLLAFGAAYLIRGRILARALPDGVEPGAADRQFHIELLLFLVTGALLTLYDTLKYGFPVSSGLKLMVGCAAIGFFVAIDLVLDREHRLACKALQQGHSPSLERIRTSLTQKFTMFAVAGVVGAMAVMFLVLAKDFEWLAMVGSHGIPETRKSVWVEILFVGTVFLALLIVVIASYSRNLRLFFDHVSNGNLDHYVPVSTGDEFGLIASRTNQMIDGLREKNRIKDMFGKFLNPRLPTVCLNRAKRGLSRAVAGGNW